MIRIVFFDGVCHLCQASVRFIIARDSRAEFRFASLQSNAAARYLGAEAGVLLDSVVLWEEGRTHYGSSAALRIARRLRAPWPLLSVFLLVPRPLRDFVYGFVARNRYRWFGRDAECWLPTPELNARFLK